MIKIGHKYGDVPVDTILPCATTVSRHLRGVVEKEKAAVEMKLKEAVTFGLTTDSWTSDLTSKQYITVTIHFLDRNWKMKSLILATREADERHTADNVRKLIRNILDEYGAYRNGIIYVTDNAANMKAAFKEEVWLGCSGHNLNLVLSHGLQQSKKAEDNELNEAPEEVTDLISTCKELVTLAKRTKINQQLEKNTQAVCDH